ncbi:uncharacterized protein LOC131631111 [Vicia villosa]|uniref:uncharacterized protein LOC131631111 n=1 Tax=Vicia villosa TaxID=3911 RepID=UPI00273C5A08|nr:uncharacterized protein LOC131631111 [Vicia villosa]
MSGGRNDDAIAEALESLAQAMAQNNQNNQNGGAVNEFCGLGMFQRNNQPTFKGRHDLEGSQTWIRKIENIFRVMACTDEQKMLFDTHMLSEEAEDWWDNVYHIMDDEEKYFPEDVHGKKDIEFLEQRQGNMTVDEYAAKFEERMKFCPYYNSAAVGDLCESSLRVAYILKSSMVLGIRRFGGCLYW